MSDAKPWTDARKWWMGIFSALFIAGAIGFVKIALSTDAPKPVASLTGTYCGSWDNQGITEVFDLIQDGNAIKGTAYFADGRGNHLSPSDIQGTVAGDGSITIVLMRKDGHERYTGVGKADANSGSIQLSGIGPNNYYSRPCPPRI